MSHYLYLWVDSLWFQTVFNCNPPIVHCYPLLRGRGILVDHWSTISSLYLDFNTYQYFHWNDTKQHQHMWGLNPIIEIRQSDHLFISTMELSVRHYLYIEQGPWIFPRYAYPDSKVHGANIGPTWVLPAPDGPHMGPMNLAMRDTIGYVRLVYMSWWWACWSVAHDKSCRIIRRKAVFSGHHLQCRTFIYKFVYIDVFLLLYDFPL